MLFEMTNLLMLNAKPPILTRSEVNSTKMTLEEHLRPDFREAGEARKLRVTTEPYAAEVHLGKTHVSCTTSIEKMPANQDRPGEGRHIINLTSSFKMETKQRADLLASLRNTLDKTGTIDLESLCIQKGYSAWHMTSNLFICDDDGGLVEAAQIAVLLSVIRTKLPSKDGPRPVTVHALPFAITFGFAKPDVCIIDPTKAETEAIDGEATVYLTANGDLYGFRKNGGIAVLPSFFSELIRTSLDIAREWHTVVMESLGPNAPPLISKIIVFTPTEESLPSPIPQEQKIEEDEPIPIPEKPDEEEGMELDPALLELYGM